MKTILIGKKWAVVDDSDFLFLSTMKWHSSVGYPETTLPRKIGHKHIRMHTMILGCPINRKLVCDHINGNTLDNRRENLRIVTESQNHWNRHDNPTGIYYHKRDKLWGARIGFHYMKKTIGYFKKREDALRAYQLAKIQRDTLISTNP